MTTQQQTRPPSAPSAAPGPWRLGGRTTPWMAMAAIAVVTFLLFAGNPVQGTDEAWFLWVSRRLARGDVLYRDVYSVTTPLAHWLSLGAVKVASTQLLVVRALSVVCFVTTLELVRRIAAARGVGLRGQVLLLAVIWLLGSPVSHRVALYSGLGVTLTVATWFVLAAGGANRSPRRLAVAGALAGLAFQSKPNVGALAVVAVMVVLAFETRHDGYPGARRTDIAIVVAGFVVAAGVVAVAVAATGGLRGYLDYVFLNKKGYLEAGVSYASQLGDAARVATTETGVYLGTRVVTATMLVPLAALVALVGAFVAARGRRRSLVEPAAFTVVGLAAIAPRFTLTHVAAATPLVAAGAFLTLRSAQPASARRPWTVSAVALVAVGLVLGIGAVAARSVDRWTGDHGRLPHLAGTPFNARSATNLRNHLDALRAATGGSVFIVKSNAGLLYLVGDLSDPTPFDIPERTDFGPDDEADAIRTLQRSRAQFVCLHPAAGEPHRRRAPLTPRKLERYVMEHYGESADFGTCRLYERR